MYNRSTNERDSVALIKQPLQASLVILFLSRRLIANLCSLFSIWVSISLSSPLLDPSKYQLHLIDHELHALSRVISGELLGTTTSQS